ncbi:MAG TPA: Dyp-type peroxidase domain-containing protein, partial [Micrococcaceae bacterium]
MTPDRNPAGQGADTPAGQSADTPAGPPSVPPFVPEGTGASTGDPATGPGLGRRSFLIGAGAGTAVTALAATGISAASRNRPDAVPAAAQAVDFHGVTQAGIYRPAGQQAQACFAAFRVLAKDRTELQSLLKTLSDKGSRLATGWRADTPVLSTELPFVAGGPPANSGVLGDDVPADSFTMTVGLAASVFDNPAYKLAAMKPVGLT